MGVVVPGSSHSSAEGFTMDPDEVRHAAQKLIQLGSQLMPSGQGVPEGANFEKSAAATSAVSAAGDHVSQECGTFLQQAGEYLQRAVQAFESVDRRSAKKLSSIDTQNM